ncbi:MAG: hypothetical protein Q8S21_04465 [Candidatus Paracaedibacteraceae bacterium]|nr:hypothetical protein [Candidatus Paracaedibacteraceae bacterium]
MFKDIILASLALSFVLCNAVSADEEVVKEEVVKEEVAKEEVAKPAE